MTPAYDEKYLSDAMRNLGEAFDFAVNCCDLDINDFAELFVSSGVAMCFGNAHPKYVSGMSGTELVFEIAEKANLAISPTEQNPDFGLSAEYWCGWIVAFYQWKTNKSFKDIFKVIPAEEILKMYSPLHEASEEKFVDVANDIFEKRCVGTKLQNQRKICGYSQRELAEKSGVNLRTLQQYETGAKDIKKASIETVLALSNVLGCKPEDVI